MVIDAGPIAITIKSLAAPFAVLDALRELNTGTGIWHNLYPEGEQGWGTAGKTIWFNFRVRNSGNITGNIYVRVWESAAVIYDKSWSLTPGQYIDVSANGPTFTMGNTDTDVSFELGH